MKSRSAPRDALTGRAALCGLLACLLLSACRHSSDAAPQKLIKEETPNLVPAEDTPRTAIRLPPPTLPEAQAALTRIYQQAVTLRARAASQLVVGDFNGDLAEDLVLVVQPAPHLLAEINSDTANWTLGEPMKAQLPALTKLTSSRPDPIRINEGERLLAIIHGYGEMGWRSPEARQTFLLKNIVGEGQQVQTAEQIRATTDKLPKLYGDVLRQRFGQQTGFLYWTGAKYAWHSVSERRQAEK